MHRNPDAGKLASLLEASRTVAVVGLSENPLRPSNGVARRLKGWGYKILPVNPNLKGPTLGERPYASLREIEEPVDIVDVFRRPEEVEPVAEEAVEIGAKTLWFQLGVVNERAAAYAEERGLTVVVDRCIAVDYASLLDR